MNFFDTSINTNPLDGMARAAFGLPQTVKGFLAINQNPRPAGIVLMHCTALLHASTLGQMLLLSDDAWAQEMRHNNGNFIAVLLRNPAIVSDPTFISLFDGLESEYGAAMTRSKWAIISRNDAARLNKVLARLRPELEVLVETFTRWATKNRTLVWQALNDMATCDLYQSGNAQMDVARLGVNWQRQGE